MIEIGALGSPRLTGSLLMAGLVAGLFGLAVLAADGALPAFSALLRGSLAELAPHAFAFGVSNVLYAVAWLAVLAGFVLLTRSLAGADGDLFAWLGLAATAMATVLGLLEASFGFTVTSWAAVEAAETGSVPAIYVGLDRWTGGIQAVYLALGFAGQAGFGAALLTSGLLPAWIGQVTVVWGLGWLVVLGLGIPAILFVMPAVIGRAAGALSGRNHGAVWARSQLLRHDPHVRIPPPLHVAVPDAGSTRTYGTRFAVRLDAPAAVGAVRGWMIASGPG